MKITYRLDEIKLVMMKALAVMERIPEPSMETGIKTILDEEDRSLITFEEWELRTLHWYFGYFNCDKDLEALNQIREKYE